MNKNLILSIDIGTSSLKAGIFESDGTLLSFKRYYHDKNKTQWDNLAFLSDFSTYSKQIHIIAISAQSPSIVPLLQNGRIGRPLFYFQENTNLCCPGCSSVFLPKAAYHQKYFPDEYQQTQAYLSLGDYLVYLLTGKKWTSLPQRTYDQAVWTDEQIEKCGLDKQKFPPILLSGETAGYTKENLPLGSEIRVLGSTYDFLAALQGMQAMQANIAGDRSGSSLGLNFFFNEKEMMRIMNEKPLTELHWNIYPHAHAHSFNAGVVFPDFGDFLEILKNEFHEEDISLLLKKILPDISEHQLHQKPKIISQSFIHLWQNAHGRDSLTKAQSVFCAYGRIIRFILHHWPLGRIKEVHCSGAPNENPIFREFKEKATSLRYQMSHVTWAELLGNVYRSRENEAKI